jgi:hypothetical protein
MYGVMERRVLVPAVQPGAGTTVAAPPAACHRGFPASLVLELKEHYSSRAHRVELAVTSLALCFVGGAAMFWFHALYRGEQGPEISTGSHWLLDSTLGFVALTPVIAVLLALVERRVLKANLRPLVVGVLFALATAPGPLLHDALVGEGTALADLAVSLFGHEPPMADHMHHAVHSVGSKVLLQMVVGGAVYVLLSYAVSLASRQRSRLRSRRSLLETRISTRAAASVTRAAVNGRRTY